MNLRRSWKKEAKNYGNWKKLTPGRKHDDSLFRNEDPSLNPTASLKRSQKFYFGYFSSFRSSSRHKMLLFSQVTILNITTLQHWNIQESGWEEKCRPQRKALNPTASLERSQKFCFGYFSSCRSCSRHKMLLMFSQVTLLNITITYKHSRTWLRREVQTPEES